MLRIVICWNGLMKIDYNSLGAVYYSGIASLGNGRKGKKVKWS